MGKAGLSASKFYTTGKIIYRFFCVITINTDSPLVNSSAICNCILAMILKGFTQTVRGAEWTTRFVEYGIFHNNPVNPKIFINHGSDNLYKRKSHSDVAFSVYRDIISIA